MDAILRPVQVLAGLSAMRKNKFHNFLLVIFLTLVTFSVIARQIIKSVNNTTGIIIASVEFVHYNSRILTTVSCLIMTNRKSHCFENFINTITRMNKQFETMGEKIDYDIIKKLARFLVILVILKVVLQQVPFCVQGSNWDLIDCLDYIVYNIPIFLIHVLLAQWITYLSILRLHFKTLNKILKTTRYRQCWVIEDFRSFKNLNKFTPQRETIRACGMMYDDLCLQGEKLNEAFAWQILFLIPSIFVLVIFNSLQTCRMIKSQIEFDCGWMIFDILYFEVFLELVVPCVSVNEEAGKFVDILHKIDVNFDGNSEIDDAVNSLILQTYHQKVEFSAYGVFPLDGTLIYSILGALTTYLVVLLQFDS